jgi:hypothetical protein
MAIEYLLYSAASVSLEELQTFFAGAVGGDIGHGGTVFREGMYVTVFRVPEDERDSTIPQFGFEHLITATFHFSNLADQQTEARNTALMVAAVLAFFHRYGHGVLLFNGERVVIQHLTEETVFSHEWDEWLEAQEVAPLIVGHRIDNLPQPLL